MSLMVAEGSCVSYSVARLFVLITAFGPTPQLFQLHLEEPEVKTQDDCSGEEQENFNPAAVEYFLVAVVAWPCFCHH